MKIENKTWQQAVQDWKDGKNVWSAKLGGISPAYEQCIQILLWEILARWEGEPIKEDPNREDYPKEYSDHVDKVANELNEKLGFSSTQVMSAKATAYQFMVYGYDYIMNQLENDRWIQVSRRFPNWDEPKQPNSERGK